MGPFLSWKTLSMTFCTDYWIHNFSLIESQCVSSPWTVFLNRLPINYRSFINQFLLDYIRSATQKDICKNL